MFFIKLYAVFRIKMKTLKYKVETGKYIVNTQISLTFMVYVIKWNQVRKLKKQSKI